MFTRPRDNAEDIPLKRENVFKAFLANKQPSTFSGEYSQGTGSTARRKAASSLEPMPIKKLREYDTE